jgi:hypothetical protein
VENTGQCADFWSYAWRYLFCPRFENLYEIDAIIILIYQSL